MTLFMTGFPGFLGSALLPGILKRTDGAAICLVQAKFAAPARRRVAELNTADPSLHGRIQLIEGDITQPGLGLGADALNGVQRGMAPRGGIRPDSSPSGGGAGQCRRNPKRSRRTAALS